ncbi:endonuclease/exonuclease/phosphatase family protein [Dyadobacter sp. CY261]|uniref:endonuclease/exonuclease/phosphatase family protein n=1 Tax=Dyadobacter sp. CY261 TaxID=2907203 RepID=UPI001F2E07D7|nr:endonuclease/exonuclease/phosphatase family protein [Dyadobacter sp. CY261]MCF0075156.1 endonuclease/exonuclease/phosphatase family protein [Dyadobacter sp. CY261]
MKGINKFLWFLYQCFVCYTLLVYALILFVPFDGWLAGFMMMSFPVVVVIHLISVPVWFLLGRKKAILPFMMFLMAGLFLSRTYGFKGSGEGPPKMEKGEFSVMSYNVHAFQPSPMATKTVAQQEVRAMKTWIINSGADVLCMPEYYDRDGIKSNSGDFFRQKGYRYARSFNFSKPRYDYRGLVILSKFPIVASRDTIFEAQNGMIQADVRIGKDTVRVIGLHLYSMTLGLSKLVSQKQMDGIESEGRVTFRKMKNGFSKRSGEFERLKRWVDQSPYPVIVCGDFNEVPYSYIYGTLRKSLANSFEKKGSGFGFTFNHLPYFIRIDHQFFNAARLDLSHFKTFSKVKFSDHYPIMGTYVVK